MRGRCRRKSEVLTLEERVSVIKKADSGTSCRAIASEFGVGKTQVQIIVKEKEDIMKRWEEGERSLMLNIASPELLVIVIWTRLCGSGLLGLDRRIYQ